MHNKPTISQTLLLVNMYQVRLCDDDALFDVLSFLTSSYPLLSRSRLHFETTVSGTSAVTRRELTARRERDRARDVQEHYEDFCHDVFEELAIHGEIEELNVCDNLADHMVGNVYVKFADEDDAKKAKAALDGRYYMGRPIKCEFSP